MPDRSPVTSAGPAGTGQPGDAAAGEAFRDVVERWPVTASARLADGVIIDMWRDHVQMPDGSAADREYITHPGAVAVLALDEQDRVLLIRQYRHPAGRLLWELPAGLRDVDGEPPLLTAQRELTEETGYRAADWLVLLDFYTSPGCSNERLRLYLARGLTEVPESERSFVREHEEAELKVGWLALDAAVGAFLAGDLHNGVTAVGILAAYAARPGGFAALRPADAPES
ncbi:MAG: NUDIX domain-containing protein [Streptosporangiaceae bacterium]